MVKSTFLFLSILLSLGVCGQTLCHTPGNGRGTYNFYGEYYGELNAENLLTFNRIDIVKCGDPAIDDISLETAKSVWPEIEDINVITLEDFEATKEKTDRHFIALYQKRWKSQFVPFTAFDLGISIDDAVLEYVEITELEFLPIKTRLFVAMKYLRGYVEFVRGFYGVERRDYTGDTVKEWERRMQEVSTKMLYLSEDYLSNGVTEESIREVYKGEFQIVSNKRFCEIIESQEDCYVLMGGNLPFEDSQLKYFTPHQTEIKFTYNPSTGQFAQKWKDFQHKKKYGVMLKDLKKVGAGKPM